MGLYKLLDQVQNELFFRRRKEMDHLGVQRFPIFDCCGRKIFLEIRHQWKTERKIQATLLRQGDRVFQVKWFIFKEEEKSPELKTGGSKCIKSELNLESSNQIL